MKPQNPLKPVLAHLRAEPSRTWSVIITFFGDAIVPRGGRVWLGTLLAFFKSMDVSETVVRSAVSRLAAEDWLVRTKVGRNSFYHLAARGQETFALAAQRIYHHDRGGWTGAFDALLVPAEEREMTDQALRQAGFGSPLPGLFIAPAGRDIPPDARGALCLKLGGTADELRLLAERSWDLKALAMSYQRFCEVFTPLQRSLVQGVALSAQEALLGRILLIHEYRRIALRDPMLPVDILPLDWPGDAAQALCAEIYKRLLTPSEAWLDSNALGEDSQPIPGNPEIYNRFKE